ncbi:tetratricopeptide repeat protein [Rhizobium rhizogenes]|uniref:tetratricopeptide repeat protein n=1 Tax=Rhizobium rhizogenes TaxID=359 RepID=UPI0015732347|nr:hypothetical protein [Rhizobium rhizogenes]NTF98287.1 hypothetical protein [Rhizobium rhizogenes]
MLEILNDGARFQPVNDERDAIDRLDDLLDRKDTGQLSLARCVKALTELVATYPDFIDGHAHLGFALLEQGKASRALEACHSGYDLATAMIPSSYRGVIEWGWLENRPFLRAAQGVALCHQQLGQRQQTIEVMQRMLKWNPNDNQGIRFLIASEYLRAGDASRASRILKKEADHFPPYQYEAALIEIAAGRMVSAATALRRAFIANGYIAEILCGMTDPLPLAVWHGSNLAEPEVARSYAEHYADLWHTTPSALQFLRWVHMPPRMMSERAEFLTIKEALLWERDGEARRRLLDREDMLLDQIDDRLSLEIVAKRQDRYNRLVEPWVYKH